MNKWCLKFLSCVALIIGTVTLLAADQPGERQPKLVVEQVEAATKDGRKTNAGPSREEREKRREEFNKLGPEEREAKRKEIKERLEKRIAELRSKQTNATLSSQESRELDRREQILKRFDQAPAPVVEPTAPCPK